MMQGPARSSASANRGWRGQGGARRPAAGARYATRILVTALGLALSGVFAWIIVRWWFLPQVYLVGLPVVDYDVLAVPPVPYAREDLEEFVQATGTPQGVLLDDLQTSAAMATLGNRLQGIVGRGRDTLILYIVAQGVSDDGKAYLLCSDYMRGTKSGRVLLSDVLRQVQQCPASLKLVILDAAHVASDPRLGMVVNEFARLAEKDLQALDDRGLWLFSAAQPLESSHVAHPLQRSVFGHFVAAGLHGAADRDGNRVVALDELYRYVRTQVAEEVFGESGGRETQTPFLLQGGVGMVEFPPNLALLPVPRRPPPEIIASSAKPAGVTGAAGNTAGNPATSPQQGHELLQEAWSLRDRIDARQGTDRWTPTDWAPHLWAEYQQLLLGYELRFRAGMAYRRDELAERLRTDILPLGSLLEHGTVPAGMGNSTILAGLAAARQQFLATPAGSEKTPAELQIVARAIHLRDDLIARAREYIRWHAAASRRSPQTLPLLEPIAELLENRLPQLIALLDTLQETGPGGEFTGSDRAARLKDLADRVDAVEALRKNIEDRGFQQLAQHLLADPATKDRLGQIDELLSTTILSAPMRRQLLDALTKAVGPSQAVPTGPDSGPEPPPADGAWRGAHWRWRRLAEQCRLESALVALADAELAARLRQPMSAVDPSPADKGQAGDLPWREYRRIGKLLGTFYQELPAHIRADLSAEPAQLRGCARLLRLVDARDAARIDDAGALLVSLVVPRLPVPVEVPQTQTARPPAVAPDVVDLVVQGTEMTVEDQGRSGPSIRLRPFPNRTTAYRFSLVNRSGRARKVSAQLLALPESLESRRRSDNFPLDTLGNLAPGVRKLYEVQIALPAGERAVAIPWLEAKAAEQKGAPGKPNPSESPQPPTARPAVTFGLACVIQDLAEGGRSWIRLLEFAPLAPRDYLDPLVSYSAAARRIVVQVRPRQRSSDGRPNVDLLPPLAPGESIKVVWETAGLLDPDTEMNDRGEVLAPDYTANLFAEVAPRSGRQVPVRLDVDGYPRAFVYQVPCDHDWDRVDRERSLRLVQITSPAQEAAFRAPVESLPVRFQVDAPEDAFQDSGDVVEIGIDESGMRRLLARSEFHGDRQSEVFLAEPQIPGLLRFTTRVHDFAVAVSPGGLRNKKVELVARLLLSNRSITSERLAAEASVGVFLDGAAPELEVDTPAAAVAQGEPLAVTAHTTDLSGVVKVEIGFDLDGSGSLEEKEKPKVLRQPDGQRSTWTAALPTGDLEPGRYLLLVRATDRVGLIAKRGEPVTILAAAKPGATPAPAVAAAAIEGQVVLIDRPCPNFNVQLDGGDKTATTDDSGRFVFKDVPPGKHTLHAKGAALNRFREGSADIVITAAAEPASVVIRLE